MSHDDVTGATTPDTAPGNATPTFLGIELGSTRIKAALIDQHGTVRATGASTWENAQVDDNWTYSLEDVWSGLQDCIAELRTDLEQRHGEDLGSVAGLGISAMMHGYLALDEQGELLVPFRTWRNTYTEDASALLREHLGRNIPLRWSVSHLLHAVLEQEEHVAQIARMTTLSGLVHHRLTGQHVLGIGDASGMFPIDADTRDWDADLLETFAGIEQTKDLPFSLRDVLPDVLVAGQDAGELTAEGAELLDPSGSLRAGIRTAPPEGDAGTGMVATNAITPRTGNVSAGTSAFAMVVLEEDLATAREEIDLVATPAGDPVAMIHANNCTGDLDAWLRLFAEFAHLGDSPLEDTELYRLLLTHALQGDPEGGGLLAYNYLSGEHQTGVSTGRPLFVRGSGADFSLATFLRTQLYSAFGALATGMRVLVHEERVSLDTMVAHGGIFRTEGVAQQILADALDVPVTVGDSAGEGGAWGMALLAAFSAHCTEHGEDAPSPETLSTYLSEQVFAELATTTLRPDPVGVAGYATWLEHYSDALPLERLAGDLLP